MKFVGKMTVVAYSGELLRSLYQCHDFPGRNITGTIEHVVTLPNLHKKFVSGGVPKLVQEKKW